MPVSAGITQSEKLVPRLFRQRKTSAADLLKVARELNRALPAFDDLGGTLHQFGETTHAVAIIEHRIRGDGSSFDVSNALTAVLAQEYVKRLPLTDDLIDVHHRVGWDVAQLAGPAAAGRMAVLSVAHVNRVKLGRMIRQLDEPGMRRALERCAHVPELKRGLPDAAAMARELVHLRHYGVKPVVFQDGMLHTPNTAVVILDGHEKRELLLQQNGLVQDTLADIYLTQGVPAADLSRTVDTSVPDLTSMGTSFQDQGRFCIRLDGQLAADPVFGAGDLRALFRECGAPDLYPLFHLVQVLRLYDLVVPLEKVRELPPWPSVSDRTQARGAEPTGLDSLPELLLPRLRLLSNRAPLAASLEREVRAATGPVAVTGHRRLLPPGRRPAPDAPQRAWAEARVVLRDNETWVKQHQRGDGEPRKGHVAVQRRAPLAGEGRGTAQGVPSDSRPTRGLNGAR